MVCLATKSVRHWPVQCTFNLYALPGPEVLLSNLLLLRSKWLDVNYFKATFAWRLFVGNSDSVFTACFTPEMICLLFVSKKSRSLVWQANGHQDTPVCAKKVAQSVLMLYAGSSYTCSSLVVQWYPLMKSALNPSGRPVYIDAYLAEHRVLNPTRIS